MIEILKAVVSLSGLAGLILLVSYFLISLSLGDIKDLYKTPINKKYIEKFSYAIFGTYIAYMFFIEIINQNSKAIYLIDIITYIHFALTIVANFIAKSVKKNIKSNEKYCVNLKLSNSMLLGILIVVILSAIAINGYVEKTNLVYLLQSLINKYTQFKMITFAAVILRIITNYICTLLLIGYLMCVALLKGLDKYIVSSNVFEEGRVIGYIVAENEEEIMLKCDDSYPIFLKKDDIDGYIMIPNDVKVEENENKIIFKNKNGEEIDYQGYLVKANSRLNN